MRAQHARGLAHAAFVRKLLGEDLALVYLQLSLYLAPNHSLALLSLADLYESVKKPQMAIKIYERVPASSPLKRNAQIQLATNLDAADRSDADRANDIRRKPVPFLEFMNVRPGMAVADAAVLIGPENIAVAKLTELREARAGDETDVS